MIVIPNFEAKPSYAKGQENHLKISVITAVPSYLQLLLRDYQDCGVPQTVA